MNFSKFSCCHSSNFLSDSIGKQSAMSKRRQEATSTEGSPMAKPKPAVPAKARPINLVLHSPWSARETLSQNLGYPVNTENDDEGQGDLTRTRKLVQKTQNPQVERSQVERQEYKLKVQILGNSTIRRKLRTLLARGNLCRQQLQERNFKIWSSRTISTWQRSSIFLQKKLGILNVLNGSSEDKCIDMGNVYGFIDESRHSSWTELFGKLGSLQEHELRGNSELVWYHTKIDIGAFWRDSKCEYDWQCISSMDEFGIVSRSGDSVDKAKVCSDSVLCLEKLWMEAKVQLKDGKVKWKNSKCLFLTKNCWESKERQLNSSGVFSQDFRHCRHRIIFMSMFNDIDWTKKGNDGIFFRTHRKSRITRRDSCKDTGRSWVLEWKRSGTELFLTPLRAKTQVIQYSRVSVLWVVEFEWPRYHTLQRGCFEHRALILNYSFCKSAQYLRSSYELVWTDRLDRGRKGTSEAERIRDQRCFWHVWNHKKKNFWYLLQN